ncbi:MAG: Rid family hydrolase [Gemmatimonadaceae bacterium]
MKFIETSDAPLPAGHYTQAIVANGLVFVSGILPIVPGGGERRIPDGIEAQARQVFANLRAILSASESEMNKIVNVQIFIPDVVLWSAVNAIYTEALGAHRPARTVVPCGPLHYAALIELNAVATT